ncbi:MAG: 50S ribosomal protein L11 methyltransferase [Methanobrevibacter sp.]|uniref:methyltransferase domain-containing protein n=1 Tax=Methanobrevibacter sp. TaxID=66852 RepID=UPI0025E71F5E|nr:methyltransferase domain-containing protein [Methanobrevibacter sp.]MBQ8018260.1 50S ribosomal protein L11 methyltransferase [Methanobrevibacter sp.]
MKFKTTPYHHDLLKDHDRLAVFYQAIQEYDSGTDLAYDLGCGSGVLSYFLSSKFKEIKSLEIDRKTFNCARENLADFDNVEVINSDVLDYNFTKKADLIVCEMLDTALVDEEEIPVLNHAKKFLKEDGIIIPQGVINTVELANIERDYVHWDEGVKYEILSDEVVYSELNFLQDINPEFKISLNLQAKKEGILNGLKITTYTKLTDDIIAGPLPMLNPPLLIPLEEKKIKVNEFINVEIKYIMGNGIESIETKYL